MPDSPATADTSDSGVLRYLRLQGSAEQLRILVDQMPASIAMFDREMRYLAVSRRWITDYQIDGSCVGVSHYEIFPEIPDHWRDVHRRCLAGESLSSDGEQFVRKDGSIQWVKWECLPWLTSTGDIAGIIIASEDITAQKEAERSLKQHL